MGIAKADAGQTLQTAAVNATANDATTAAGKQAASALRALCVR